MTFEQLLARFDALLQQHRPDYYAQLGPPTTDAEMAAVKAAFALVLPPELRHWYGWRNGQAPFCFDSLVGPYEFPSLADVADSMRINCELLADGDFVANWWRPSWFPFLTNGSGDHLCLDLEGTFTGQPGQLIEHWNDDATRTVVFPTLSAWLAAAVAAYETAGATTPEITADEAVELELALPAGFPLEFAAG
jgi:cell wall assembly regulator SMI1